MWQHLLRVGRSEPDSVCPNWMQAANTPSTFLREGEKVGTAQKPRNVAQHVLTAWHRLSPPFQKVSLSLRARARDKLFLKESINTEIIIKPRREGGAIDAVTATMNFSRAMLPSPRVPEPGGLAAPWPCL